MEIITGVERRRHWRTEDKLRIVAEAERPGARFVDVARRHEVSRGLLRQWRDQARRGVLVAERDHRGGAARQPQLDTASRWLPAHRSSGTRGACRPRTISGAPPEAAPGAAVAAAPGLVLLSAMRRPNVPRDGPYTAAAGPGWPRAWPRTGHPAALATRAPRDATTDRSARADAGQKAVS